MEQQSIARLKLLHPAIRYDALDAYSDAVQKTPRGIHPYITETLRTFERSDFLYSLGRTIVNPDGKSSKKPMGNIVTNAKAGQSYHNFGLACFDSKTRVFTDKGLRYFNELDGSEKVVTWKDGLIEFQKPISYISNQYNSKMVSVKTRSVDLLVTPNHKMIVKRKTNSKWDLVWNTKLASELDYKYKIPTAGLSIHRDNDLSIFKKSNVKIDIKNTEDWWEFMGYYLSEGSSCGVSDNTQRKHNGRFSIKISQYKNSPSFNKIKNCLDRLGFKYRYSGHDFTIHSKSLWEILFPIGNSYQKYIPKYLLRGDVSHLNKLYYALIDGDGSYYNNGEAYFSVSKKLCEDVLLLSLLINKGATISSRIRKVDHILPQGECQKSKLRTQFSVRTRMSNTQELRNGADNFKCIKKEDYNGIVYCVETKAGAILVERNGKTCVCGNCDFVIWDDGKSSWVVDDNWMIVVECFKRKGFSWGGDFSSIKDNPHLEKRGKYYWRDLLIKYNKKDFIEEPKYVNITL